MPYTYPYPRPAVTVDCVVFGLDLAAADLKVLLIQRKKDPFAGRWAFPGGFVYNSNQRGLGSITGRFGYTWGPGLVYVKGGYAYSDNAERVTLAGAPIPFLLNGNHSNGWTVGGGVEYMLAFAPNWSVKGEYMYYDFGSTRFVTPAALAPFGNFTTEDHTLKLGVNYRFNFASPVAARY